MNFRSRKLLNIAKDMPCQACGIQDGTIVPAHANGSLYGKGMGMKSHDCFFAALCHRCHFEYDQGNSMSRSEKEAFFYHAMLKTWLWAWRNERIKVA